MELDLTGDGKGSAEVNTGQLFLTLDGIEGLNMTQYPKKTTGNSNARQSAAAATASPQSSANRYVLGFKVAKFYEKYCLYYNLFLMYGLDLQASSKW